MRDHFIKRLHELAECDSRIVLVTGDLGFGVFDRFREERSGQFINAGVSEQNMTMIATGMAIEGRIVFTYSIGNFPTLRCLEMIRNDAAYHDANVKVVCIGGGFSYGANGPTHHAIEDIAIMRVLPDMTVVAPGDPLETEQSVAALININGPAYLRLGRSGDPPVHKVLPDFSIGESITIREGTDCTLISTGGMLPEAVRTAELLANKGIESCVVSMHTIKPLDEHALEQSFRTHLTVTLEEHSCIGGLGSAVSEWMATKSVSGNLLVVAANDSFATSTGSQEFLRRVNGLNAEAIAPQVLRKLTQ